MPLSPMDGVHEADGECGLAHVFISYDRADYAYAERLVAFLKAAGISVWWDSDIVAGESFGQRIQQAVDVSAAFIPRGSSLAW